MEMSGGRPAVAPRSFAELVSGALSARGISSSPTGDVVRIDAPHQGVLVLTNVWQLCLQSPPRQWQGIVNRFLDTVLPGLEPPPDEDFAAVRPSLRVRVLSDGPGVPGETADLEHPVADGVRAVLAIDRPTMVELVPAKRATRWGVGRDVLFRIAYANVRAEPPPTPTTLDFDGLSILRFTGASFYTTSWVQWLADLVDPMPPAGALVGLPGRHEFLVHPVDGMSAVHALHPMLALTSHAYHHGPGSLSPHLYWWRGGTLSRLPRVTKAGTTRVLPPDEFLDALNGAA